MFDTSLPASPPWRVRFRAIVPRAIAFAILYAAAGAALARENAASQRFDNAGAIHRFAEVLDAVQKSPAPMLVGPERWTSLVEEHRPDIEQARTHEDFARRVNALFAATHQSHFHYLTDEEWSYWHLLSAFYRNIDTAVEHIGIYPEQVDGQWFVRGFLEGSPTEKLDIREGDELVSVNGRPYTPIRAFTGLAGHNIPLELRRRAGGPTHTITVQPVREPLADAVGRAMERSVAMIPDAEGPFAYAHIWMMLGGGQEYQRLLDMQSRVSGLVLDLRDGVGGTPMHGHEFLLGKDDGRSTPRKTWTKPVVILIADGTRSAKELLVYQAHEAGRAVLVGTPTPGDVTAVGGMPRVGDDAVLILPGFRFELEGKPTHPDFAVDRSLPYAAGRDPQLDKAVAVLENLVRSRAAAASDARRPEASTPPAPAPAP